MFDLNRYLDDLIANCRSAFGERLLYIGLQGSWLRGEAREDSDIDVMVILDRFSVQDMDTYRGILNRIGSYERTCGFICGKDEMKRWNPLEICQLRHTTKDLVGVLTGYLPPATREDEISYVNLSLGNMYHELCQGPDGPVNWGHCGISLGDGRVIHAWDMIRVDDYLAIEKLTALTGNHPEYLGWVPLECVVNQKPSV